MYNMKSGHHRHWSVEAVPFYIAGFALALEYLSAIVSDVIVRLAIVRIHIDGVVLPQEVIR